MTLLDSTMRDAFIERLFALAQVDSRVVLLTNDFGAPALDQWREKLPDQVFHMGIAEANAVNVAAGLAMEGMKPYVYSISPFVPMRCAEQIRLHVGVAGLPIRFLVVGAGYSYDKSGPTHHSLDDLGLLVNVPNLNVINPSDTATAKVFADISYTQDAPWYIRLDRGKFPILYGTDVPDWQMGFIRHGSTDPTVVLFATGAMVHAALRIAQELGPDTPPEEVAVVDVFRLHPFPKPGIEALFPRAAYLIAMEENFPCLSNFVAAIDDVVPRFAVPVKFHKEYGGRDALLRLSGLDHETIVRKLKETIAIE